MMEVAPCATPLFYTLHFTFYISHAAATFRPSALGKSHRHEPGAARHEHLCSTITSSAISQEIERSFFAACDQSLIMRIALEHQSRISAPRTRHHQNHIPPSSSHLPFIRLDPHNPLSYNHKYFIKVALLCDVQYMGIVSICPSLAWHLICPDRQRTLCIGISWAKAYQHSRYRKRNTALSVLSYIHNYPCADRLATKR